MEKKFDYEIELARGNNGYGFTVSGGKGDSVLPYVKDIIGGPAVNTKLRKGDQIVEINGVTTENMGHLEAMEEIKSGETSVKLRLKRESPTVEGTPKNRMEHFVISAVTEFIVRAQKVILDASDKNNVDVKQVKEIATYISDVAEQGVGLGVGILLAPTGPVAVAGGKTAGKLGGKLAGRLVGLIAEKGKQHFGHESAKKLQPFFNGFKAENEDWIELLVETFFCIFINFNPVFCDFLECPIDAWSKVVLKLAQDAVARIFNYLEKKFGESEEKKLTQKLLIKGFLEGESGGRQIKLKSSTHKSPYIFDEPIQIFRNEDGSDFAKPVDKEKLQDNFFRHVFQQEENGLDTEGWEKIQLPRDRYDDLLGKKKEMYKEIVNKFKAKDKVICEKIVEAYEYHSKEISTLIQQQGKEIATVILQESKLNKDELAMVRKCLDRIEKKLNLNTFIIALGNPGSGKSTILNSLGGEVFFKSGYKMGAGLTTELGMNRTKIGTLLDTPGLADPSLRKEAAKEITNGLKQDGDYKVLFFLTEEDGRVVQQDVTTMRLVLDAVPQIGKRYGIVVNMVCEKTLEKVNKNPSDFLDILFTDIPNEKRCPQNYILCLGVVEELEEEDDVLALHDMLKNDTTGVTLYDFVNDVVPIIKIKAEDVKDVKVENFDETIERLEKLALERQGKKMDDNSVKGLKTKSFLVP